MKKRKTGFESFAQELVSFNRVAEVATSKGYTYQNDATASTTGAQQ